MTIVDDFYEYIESSCHEIFTVFTSDGEKMFLYEGYSYPEGGDFGTCEFWYGDPIPVKELDIEEFFEVTFPSITHYCHDFESVLERDAFNAFLEKTRESFDIWSISESTPDGCYYC